MLHNFAHLELDFQSFPPIFTFSFRADFDDKISAKHVLAHLQRHAERSVEHCAGVSLANLHHTKSVRHKMQNCDSMTHTSCCPRMAVMMIHTLGLRFCRGFDGLRMANVCDDFHDVGGPRGALYGPGNRIVPYREKNDSALIPLDSAALALSVCCRGL